ncbi:MAG: transglutaminase-like domain-containing protein [Nanoarchaeota archaeon]
MDPLENTVELTDLSRRLSDPQGRQYATACNIFEFIRDNVKYEGLVNSDGSRRPYRSPSETLKAGAGCCYEMSALVISLSRSAGLITQAVLAGYDRGLHMVVEVALPACPIIIDPTAKNGYAMLLEKTDPLWSRKISDDEVRKISKDRASGVVWADIFEFRGRLGGFSKLALALLVGLGAYVNYAGYNDQSLFSHSSVHSRLERQRYQIIPEFR